MRLETTGGSQSHLVLLETTGGSQSHLLLLETRGRTGEMG